VKQLSDSLLLKLFQAMRYLQRTGSDVASLDLDSLEELWEFDDFVKDSDRFFRYASVRTVMVDLKDKKLQYNFGVSSAATDRALRAARKYPDFIELSIRTAFFKQDGVEPAENLHLQLARSRTEKDPGIGQMFIEHLAPLEVLLATAYIYNQLRNRLIGDKPTMVIDGLSSTIELSGDEFEKLAFVATIDPPKNGFPNSHTLSFTYAGTERSIGVSS